MKHPVVQKIRTTLEDHDMWFEYFEHAPVITSEEAETVRPSYTLAQGTKALIVRVKIRGGGKKFVMIVVSGDRQFDVKKVKKVLCASDIRFAREDEVAQITEGVRIGGIPPFGNLFGLEVFADEHIFDNEVIIFSAGDRTVSIAMKSKDYKIVVNPQSKDIT